MAELRQARVYRFGDRSQPQVALTFDDGPDTRWTPQILDVLRSKRVRATFFVLGKEAEKNPAILRRIAAEGHIIGNHGYRHANYADPSQVRRDIEAGEAVIQRTVGVRTRLLRPPYGVVNQNVLRIAGEKGYSIILWAVDPEDWRGRPASAIANHVLRNVQNGDIILLHSGEGPNLTGTVQALPQIIDGLRNRGIQPVTIPDLLDIPEYHGV